MTDLTSFYKTDLVDDHTAADVNNLIAAALRSEYKNVETLSADRELVDEDTPIQRFDCGAADRVVVAPEADSVNNHPYWIINASAAARSLTIMDNAEAVTIAVLVQGEARLIIPDGAGGYLAAGGGGSVSLPEGTLINGRILPSVSSNNLTISLKTIAGADPSAGDPVQVRIGNVYHSITSALSVTKNAGTNWTNAGGAGLATKEVDYFVYLGYNATDGVVVGFSRIPFADIYSDFSATSTNEKYCAISTVTNAAATDNYVNVGRFAATLSAGAGYTWTVPTFTGLNLIQRPVYVSRFLSFTPAFTNLIAGNGTHTGRYQVDGRKCYFEANFVFGDTSSISGTLHLIQIPFPNDGFFTNSVSANDAGIATYNGSLSEYSSGGSYGEVLFFKVSGTSIINSPCSSTVPFTWMTNDTIAIRNGYYLIA